MKKGDQKASYLWQPVSLNYLLSHFKVDKPKVIAPIFLWAFLIFGCLFSIHHFLPLNWLSTGDDKIEIIKFFILYPSLIVGLLLFFWMGFEWGFVPVFISSFALAFQSGMPTGWSLLFGFSFVFGLALFGLAYQSLRIPYNLRSLKSIALFIGVSFVASLASSLGAFVWSLWHGLSAYHTALIWKGWWTGTFFQTLLITGPLLVIFSPSVEALKKRCYGTLHAPNISRRWIYGTVFAVTSVLICFIFAGKLLGKYRVNEVLDNLPNIMRGDVIGALSAFEIMIWLSIGLIFITGYTAIYLIGRWNRELRHKVERRTKLLEQKKQALSTALDQKKLMLRETHHRVKNNLAQIQALLQLQMMTVDDEHYTRLIEDSTTRLHSMSLIHQTLYDTEQYSSISLDDYLHKLCNVIHQSFKRSDTEVELQFRLSDHTTSTDQAVPLGLLVTETLINAYKYAFEGRAKGVITITIHPDEEEKLLLSVRDDGVGIPHESLQKKNSLGMELIRKLSRQIGGELQIDTDHDGTRFALRFKPEPGDS